MTKTTLIDLFHQLFERKPEVIADAPGRVNLLGEHTDYNEGFVFPAAINRSITILAAPREDDLARVWSVDFNQVSEFDINAITKSRSAPWSNYLRGVVDQLRKRGFKIQGGDFLVSGNVPVGSGLSSSAAYEVAGTAAFRAMFDLDLDNSSLALLAQAAEREFVGVQCGIMDQFVSANAQRSSALFLDCRDLTFDLIPLPKHLSIVVCDSNIRRELNNSAYNERRKECEEAVTLLKKIFPRARSLRDISEPELEKGNSLLNETLYRRARHVITENHRVLQGIRFLEEDKATEFGQLLYQSHASLRDWFEVSCPQLDLLVEIASKVPGTFGSRMTGAGFGGCTVSLVDSNQVADFKRIVKEKYDRETGENSKVYACKPSAGVKTKTL